MGSIKKLLSRAGELGLCWPLPDDLDDAGLALLFYPSSDTIVSLRYITPDWPVVHQELKRKGMTKQLLWEEYTASHPNRCYSYSQYCDRYRHWLKKQKRSMRQTHKAGECSVSANVACVLAFSHLKNKYDVLNHSVNEEFTGLSIL